MTPSPSLLDYAPTKAAVVAFTKALARQLAFQRPPGQPAELAPVYVLLAFQQSSYVTGRLTG